MKKTVFSIVLLVFFLLFPIRAMAYDNITIVIDPGHGGPEDTDADTGAKYTENLLEKNIDLITARALRDELSQYPNLTVYMTRDDDVSVSLKDRIDYAASVGADLVISVHYNASSTHLFYGAEIFTSAFGSCYTTGYGVASCIMKRWKDFGLLDKGIKTRLGEESQDYYGVIRHGKNLNIPVIIIEHGYLDNLQDYEKIGSEEAWQRLGRIDADGIADYYGLEKNVMAGTVTPTVSVNLPDDIVYPDDSAPTNIRINLESSVLKEEHGTKSVEHTFRITADEPESRLMYYGLVLSDKTVDRLDDNESIREMEKEFTELQYWGDRESVTEKILIPQDYNGNLFVIVYNIYGQSSMAQIPVKAVVNAEAEKEMESVSDNGLPKEEEEPPAAVSGNTVPKEGSGAENGNGSPASITVEHKAAEPEAKAASGKLQAALEEAGSNTTMIYGLIFVLATIVFILLIIIIALIKQGTRGEKDDYYDF
ncbi:MAG: N-acetylmuramoyl-L-alanine amidase [Lachnospiraceae bacterium]|nr:N-acetylmuramoyl-L-alanine amidase [Lachnospiraceae bacterium]